MAAVLVMMAGTGLAGETVLHPAYPNPFNPTTVIPYDLGADAHVELSIFDGKGKQVRTLVDDRRRAGRHEVLWNGADARGRTVAGGVYFCRLRTSTGDRQIIRLILLK